MKNRGNTIRLYNVIFPVWLLWLVPITWIVVLPGNFIIDLLVTMLTMKCMKVKDIKANAKAVIFKVWIFGFISDFIGTVGMFLSQIINFNKNETISQWWYKHIIHAVAYEPFSSIYAILWITVCVLISGLCIYFFNYKFAFKKLELSILEKKKLAISLAVFTAPYLFYLPTKWFF